MLSLPRHVLAGLALCCLMGTCLSFMKKLKGALGWMRWDNLTSDAGDTGGSSVSLPSLVEDHHGTTTVHTRRSSRGTSAAMLAGAFTLEADDRQI